MSLIPHPELVWRHLDISGGPDACWPWTGARSRLGYGLLFRTVDGKERPFRASRVMFEQSFGPIPNGMVICHTCDNPPCCNPDHLFVGTQADNVRDRVQKGRSATGARNGRRTHPERTKYGEQHHNAKLTDQDVQSIRIAHAAGLVGYGKLSKQFGVSKTQIQRIVRGLSRLSPAESLVEKDLTVDVLLGTSDGSSVRQYGCLLD